MIRRPAEDAPPLTGVSVVEAREGILSHFRPLEPVPLPLAESLGLVLAGVFIHVWWLALLFVVVSIPLPWVAVLIANDRPPRKQEEINRYNAEKAARRALEREVSTEGAQDGPKPAAPTRAIEG